MAKQLGCLSIHPGDNGGHRIVHDFKRAPAKRGAGEIYMDRPKSEEHLFGKGEDGKAASHVLKAMGWSAKGECPAPPPEQEEEASEE